MKLVVSRNNFLVLARAEVEAHPKNIISAVSLEVRTRLWKITNYLLLKKEEEEGTQKKKEKAGEKTRASALLLNLRFVLGLSVESASCERMARSL